MGGSVCEQRARALTTALHRELKDRGFRKRSSWLRAHRPGEPIGVVHVLGVQLTQGSQKRDCSAVVTVGAGLVGLPGIAVDLERVRVQDCLVTHRIGDQWDLDDELDGIASELGDVAREWFAARDAADAILAPFGERDPGSVRAWLGQVEPVVAASVVRGDRERALALLEAKRGLVSGRAVERLDDLGKTLGLIESDSDDFLV
ncbi:MAG: hypothetical protein AAF602_19900 [Myxococcota bacterium]